MVDVVLAAVDDELGVDDAQPLKVGVGVEVEEDVGEIVRVPNDESEAVPVPEGQKVLAAVEDAELVTLGVELADEPPVTVRVIVAVLVGVPEREARPEAVDEDESVETVLAVAD